MNKKEVIGMIGGLSLAILFTTGVIYASTLKSHEIEEEPLFLGKPEQFAITKGADESPYMYYELEDRYIYTYDMIDSIKYNYNNEEKELSQWFKEDATFLDKMLENMQVLTSKTNKKDGGSIEYHDGNMGIIVCNTLDGNKNIYIGEKLEYDFAGCNNYKKITVLEKKKDDKVVNIIDKRNYTFNEYPCVNLASGNDSNDYFYVDEAFKYKYALAACSDVVVLYESGFEEPVKDAFLDGSITLDDLDKYDISYHKKKISKKDRETSYAKRNDCYINWFNEFSEAKNLEKIDILKLVNINPKRFKYINAYQGKAQNNDYIIVGFSTIDYKTEKQVEKYLEKNYKGIKKYLFTYQENLIIYVYSNKLPTENDITSIPCLG